MISSLEALQDGQRMKVLVCGGAGYIGSHFVRELLAVGSYDIIVFDNLSKGISHGRIVRATVSTTRLGHRDTVPGSVVFEEGDIRDKQRLDQVFEMHKPSAVFVSSCRVENVKWVQPTVSRLSIYTGRDRKQF